MVVCCWTCKKGPMALGLAYVTRAKEIVAANGGSNNEHWVFEGISRKQAMRAEHALRPAGSPFVFLTRFLPNNNVLD